MAKASQNPPICPYCRMPAVFRQSSAHLHRGRDYGPVWECEPCGAYAGCHGTSSVPLGTLANKALRMARTGAHAAFEPLWKARMRQTGCSKGRARGAGYRWLAEQLGMAPKDCHIAMMDEADCVRVILICRPARNARPRSARGQQAKKA